jgi:replicative DNA helicase
MSNSFVRIVKGTYRNRDVSGWVFPLVQQYRSTPSGGYVLVENNGAFPNMPEQIRISVEGVSSYEFVNQEHTMPVKEKVVARAQAEETDEEAIARIRSRFEILDEMTTAATNGDIRAMIVSGPPGVGKSFGVERIIEKACLFDQISGTRLRAEVVKGSASAIGLYKTLYKYSDTNCVVVFDDCDSILLDDVALNLLKGALDSGKKRKISWLSESSALRREGVPESFTFNGSVIFITNLKFDSLKSQKLKDHLEALQSRCHYLDLTLDSVRDKILRIRQVSQDTDLFEDMDLNREAQEEVIDFMHDNQNKLREISLRMAIKIAQLRKSFPLKWKEMSRVTCMKSAA